MSSQSGRSRGSSGRGSSDRGSNRGRGRGDGNSSRGSSDRGARGSSDSGSRGGARGGGDNYRGRGDYGARGGGEYGARGGGDYGGRGGGRGGGGDYRGGGGGRGGRGARGGGRGGPSRPFVDPNFPIPQLDNDIHDIEEQYGRFASSGVASITSATSQLSVAADSKAVSFPARPGYAKLGTKVHVYANYFKISAKAEDITLFRYNVEVSPEARGRKLMRVFELLLEDPRFAGVATEYKSMVISRELLDIPGDNIITLQYRLETEATPRENAPVYTIRVLPTAQLSVSDLVQSLSAMDHVHHPSKVEILQALNVVLGQRPREDIDTVTYKQTLHFSVDLANNRHNSADLSEGLQSLRGFYQSVRPATGGLLLNVNVHHGVFLNAVRLDMLYGMMRSKTKRDIERRIRLARVRLLHIAPTRSNVTKRDTYRDRTISGMAKKNDGSSVDAHRPRVKSDFAGPKDVEFWYEPSQGGSTTGPQTARYISVFNYFKLLYPQIRLESSLSVVNAGTKEKPTYFPAEVCEIKPGQLVRLKLGPVQTKNMIRFACRRPYENGASIIGDGRSILGLNAKTNPTLSRFGVNIGKSLVVAEARQLQAPFPMYAGKSTVQVRDGSWNFANKKAHTGANIGEWAAICLFYQNTGEYSRPDIKAAIAGFRDFMQRFGMNSSRYNQIPDAGQFTAITFDYAQNEPIIRQLFNSLTNYENGKLKIALVILPFADTALYNCIKTVADMKGIHTVCVVLGKFMKPQGQDQYFGNIALKFNLKCGGVNHILAPNDLGIIAEGKTMLFGIDVTHPNPGSRETAPSIAGVVSSKDAFLAQWHPEYATQTRREEMVDRLEDMFVKCLKAWQAKNRVLPENIIVYRDGVSEGQYYIIMQREYPQMQRAITRLYEKNKKPKVTIVVCGKRHHTRFFPAAESSTDRYDNCPAGTVVDRTVTECRNWDFYLQAHASLQGTAKPCHYFVILNEVFTSKTVKYQQANSADTLESLTYNLSHLFGRATKAVSLCPPAYYADILCERVRRYLFDQFDPPTDTDSQFSGSTNVSVLAPPPIHEKLVGSMFFI